MRDDADRTTGRRLFQACGAATGNDRSPKVDLLTGGTMRDVAVAPLQCRLHAVRWVSGNAPCAAGRDVDCMASMDT